MNQQLQYSFVDQESIPGEGRIANIAMKKASKTWNLPSSDDFFIFTIKFPAPSVVAFLDIKGCNTYIVDLTFKDYNEAFITSKSLTFHPHDESKIVQIWERPLATFVDVKLLNNSQDRMKLGLCYLIFLGKCDYLKNAEENVIPTLKSTRLKETELFNDRRKHKLIDLDGQPAIERSNQVIEVLQEDVTNSRPMVDLSEGKSGQIYFDDQGEPQPHSLHSSVFQKASLKSADHRMQIQQPYEYSQADLQDKIVEPDRSTKAYVTYPYHSDEPWWNIMQFVSKQWVDAQRKVETEKQIREEDRMSGRIVVKHLFGKKIMVDGVELERRNIIERTAVEMGALIIGEVQNGCILVTTREYGQQIKGKKRYKPCKIVTEEFVYNCRRFNARLKEEDYLIR